LEEGIGKLILGKEGPLRNFGLEGSGKGVGLGFYLLGGSRKEKGV